VLVLGKCTGKRKSKQRLSFNHFYFTQFIFCATLVSGFAQVSNNTIANRVPLVQNSNWFRSSTRNASVEWDCINKALTNKCLIYHNDQWFSLTPLSSGTFFINIRNQRCNNLQGVQVVIIEGDPCKTDTYRLVQCIDYTEQSDIFVKLDRLHQGKEYLVNIDGYLNDQCDFEIQFSDAYNGIPAKAEKENISTVELTSSDSIVNIQFALADSLKFEINKLLLLRKNSKEKKSIVKAETSLLRNALGSSDLNFTWADTLRVKGDFTYTVLGVKNDNVIVLAAENILYKGKPLVSRTYIQNIAYYSKRRGKVLVHILDEGGGKRLYSSTRDVVEGRNSIAINFSEYVRKGILVFRVVISDKGGREEYPVRFDAK
jgi:hypothetical protein